jgi:SAM-dependent methyltransferase
MTMLPQKCFTLYSRLRSKLVVRSSVTREVNQGFNHQLDRLISRVRGYVPFSRVSMGRRFLGRNNVTLLDCGCGAGEPAKFLKGRRNLSMVGVDIWLPTLRRARQLSSHDAYVLADIRYLPFRPKSFDVILAMEVVEHLEKEEASRFIKAMENTARKQVILTVPVGKYDQGACGGNPYQKHRCCWSPGEMKRLGYKVRGYGLLGTLGRRLASYFPKIMAQFVIYTVKIVPSPLTYFIPELASSMVCVKVLASGCRER